jgi:hypothetical protein
MADNPFLEGSRPGPPSFMGGEHALSPKAKAIVVTKKMVVCRATRLSVESARADGGKGRAAQAKANDEVTALFCHAMLGQKQ